MKHIIAIISTGLLIVNLILTYLFPGILNHFGVDSRTLSLLEIIITISIVVCVTMIPIALYIYHFHVKKEEWATRIDESLKKVDDNDLLKKIFGNNTIEAYKITNDPDIYDDIVNDAKKRITNTDTKEISMMHFSDKFWNIDKKVKDDINFLKMNAKVKQYRIVTIHNKVKLVECIKLVKEIYKNEDVHNFYLAYLQIDAFDEAYLPKITGVQILDDEIILMHPKISRLDFSPSALDHPPMYIKSKEIADIYSNYYLQLWREIDNYHNYFISDDKNEKTKCETYKGYKGHILCEGGEEMKISDISVWININAKLKGDRLSEHEIKQEYKEIDKIKNNRRK